MSDKGDIDTERMGAQLAELSLFLMEEMVHIDIGDIWTTGPIHGIVRKGRRNGSITKYGAPAFMNGGSHQNLYTNHGMILNCLFSLVLAVYIIQEPRMCVSMFRVRYVQRVEGPELVTSNSSLLLDSVKSSSFISRAQSDIAR